MLLNRLLLSQEGKQSLKENTILWKSWLPSNDRPISQKSSTEKAAQDFSDPGEEVITQQSVFLICEEKAVIYKREIRLVLHFPERWTWIKRWLQGEMSAPYKKASPTSKTLSSEKDRLPWRAENIMLLSVKEGDLSVKDDKQKIP